MLMNVGKIIGILDFSLACLVPKTKAPNWKILLTFRSYGKTHKKQKLRFSLRLLFSETKKISITAVHMCFKIFSVINKCF